MIRYGCGVSLPILILEPLSNPSGRSLPGSMSAFSGIAVSGGRLTANSSLLVPPTGGPNGRQTHAVIPTGPRPPSGSPSAESRISARPEPSRQLLPAVVHIASRGNSIMPSEVDNYIDGFHAPQRTLHYVRFDYFCSSEDRAATLTSAVNLLRT